MSIRTALHLTDVRWKVTFLVAMAVVLLYAPFVISMDEGIFFLTLLVLCPLSAIFSLVLLIAALVERKSRVASGLLVNGITISLVSATMFLTPFYEARLIRALENKVSWTLDKKKYKMALRSQPSRRTELNHIVFRPPLSGGEIDVWLVFDPSDRLGGYVERRGFVPNVSCPVWNVEKLSKNYYVFYEDADFSWNYCPDELRSR